jgi:beta-N-acetylhexosaminidase
VVSRALLFVMTLSLPVGVLASRSQRAAQPPAPSRPATAAGGSASERPGAGSPAAIQAAEWARAAAITNSMTLPQKVGQLLVPTIPGTRATDGGAALVRDYHLGGVIYFPSNIRTARQVAALSNGLQQAALAQHPGVPLLIVTDQEGGIVARLAGMSTLFPDQMAAGATRDPAHIRAEEHTTGTQLRALGINLDYAPVADVNVDPANPVIGIRSFGSHPALVSAMTAAAIEGFHAAGIAATAKHFPGHGDTNVDSHTGLPVIHHTERQWWRVDAPPFRAAIRARVDVIMIAHIEVPALDPASVPASLSHPIVTGLLRDRLGYRGVVTTDSLQMAGVLQGHTGAQVAVMAIQAGCDQLLMPASVPVAYHAIMAAVSGGQISMTRLETSVTRIIALKLARALPAHAEVDVASAAGQQNTPADREVAQRLANRSVTMVNNEVVAGTRRVLPLPGRTVYLAGPAGRALAPYLEAALGRTGGRLAASLAASDVIVVATQNATTDPAQRSLVASLAETGRPVVMVATGVPYDLGLLRSTAAGLATYSSAGVSLAAAAAVLTGELGPAGRLPVAVPEPGGGIVYPYGTGLHY